MSIQTVLTHTSVPKWPREILSIVDSKKRSQLSKEDISSLKRFFDLLVVPQEVSGSIFFALENFTHNHLDQALNHLSLNEKRRLQSRCYSNISDVFVTGIQTADIPTINFALLFGANPRSIKDPLNSILIDSVYSNLIVSAELSLKFGADANCNGKNGEYLCSLLMVCAKYQLPHLLELLLDYGADRSRRTPTKKTALDYANALDDSCPQKSEIIDRLEHYFPVPGQNFDIDLIPRLKF